VFDDARFGMSLAGFAQSRNKKPPGLAGGYTKVSEWHELAMLSGLFR
jgi:hypothetical protein